MRYGGEFITVASEERTSKAGSIKHNVGGVRTELVPNPEAIEKLRRDYEEQQFGG
jgi:hypothetical protein